MDSATGVQHHILLPAPTLKRIILHSFDVKDDIVLSVERGEFMTMHSHEGWEIIGTEGSLKLTMGDGEPESVIYNRTTTAGGVVSTTLAEVGDAPESQHSTPLSDFAACIRENRQPLTSLENALVVQKITDAIYDSAETGNAVEIGE